MSDFGLRLLRRLVVAGCLFVVGPLAALAENLPIDAFYGRFQGSGIAENRDSLYFGVTVRDLDVAIGPDGEGFFVEWTSVIRGGGDPANPEIKRRAQRLKFVTAPGGGMYLATGPQDPTKDGFTWARIADQTLTVNVMLIRPDGSYAVQTYDRTLTGTGMALKFVNVTNGEPTREVSARLVKTGN
jgi:hypothetical protein